METRWPVLAMLALLLGGCARESAPPAPTVPNFSAAKAEPGGKVDSFGLPLEIVLEPPEAPKEIARPLPPVKEESPQPSPPAPLPKGKGTTSTGRIGK